MSQPRSSSNSSESNQLSHADPPKKQITVHIKSQDGNTVRFSITRKLKFSELFREYCKRRQFDYRTVRFLHEGRRLQGKLTAAMLKLEDGAEIYCLYQMNGGGYYIMPKTT